MPRLKGAFFAQGGDKFSGEIHTHKFPQPFFSATNFFVQGGDKFSGAASYIIIPCTFEPGHDGNFVLQVCVCVCVCVCV